MQSFCGLLFVDEIRRGRLVVWYYRLLGARLGRDVFFNTVRVRKRGERAGEGRLFVSCMAVVGGGGGGEVLMSYMAVAVRVVRPYALASLHVVTEHVGFSPRRCRSFFSRGGSYLYTYRGQSVINLPGE